MVFCFSKTKTCLLVCFDLKTFYNHHPNPIQLMWCLSLKFHLILMLLLFQYCSWKNPILLVLSLSSIIRLALLFLCLRFYQLKKTCYKKMISVIACLHISRDRFSVVNVVLFFNNSHKCVTASPRIEESFSSTKKP